MFLLYFSNNEAYGSYKDYNTKSKKFKRMILTVIGARPQFVKAAVVSRVLAKKGIEEKIIHTGQHYDTNMSDVFWKDLSIPEPYINLKIGSGSHAVQTANMMIQLEDEFNKLSPAAVMVYGDTNSTIAAALVASKLNIKIIHVEAGLRSFNRSMPEEVNRVVTDQLSDLLFCSSESAAIQLAKENITNGVSVVGDVMYDAQLLFTPIAESLVNIEELLPFSKGKEFILATIHRPSNTDDPERLRELLSALGILPYQIIWPLHPRIERTIPELNNRAPNIHLLEPLSYFETQVLLKSCAKVCTDSGGLQKEAYWAKKQCITLREETEWVECMHNNWNILAGSSKQRIINAVNSKVDQESWVELYGNGDAGEKIGEVINEFLKSK